MRAVKEVEATDLMTDWKRSERKRLGEDRDDTPKLLVIAAG